MYGPGDEDNDDDQAAWEMDNDPYSDDEKEQMGSSEFFNDND